jgi:hypothetical protein
MDSKVENDRLKSQVNEMTAFLGDYGMEWVGERENFQEEMIAESIVSTPYEVKDGFPFDIERIRRMIRELNNAAGS